MNDHNHDTLHAMSMRSSWLLLHPALLFGKRHDVSGFARGHDESADECSAESRNVRKASLKST